MCLLAIFFRHEEVEKETKRTLFRWSDRHRFAVVDHCAKLRVDCDLAYPLKSFRSDFVRVVGAAPCARDAIDFQTLLIVEARILGDTVNVTV